VRKDYLALAVGVPAVAEFTVDAPIDRDDSNECAALRTASLQPPSSLCLQLVCLQPVLPHAKWSACVEEAEHQQAACLPAFSAAGWRGR
jgi:hypothetical protein